MLSDVIYDAVCDITQYLTDEQYASWYKPTDMWLNALLPTMLHTALAYDQLDQAKCFESLIDLYHPEIKEIAANRDAVNGYFTFRLHRDAQVKVLELFRNNDLDGMNQYIREKRQALGMGEAFSYFAAQD